MSDKTVKPTKGKSPEGPSYVENQTSAVVDDVSSEDEVDITTSKPPRPSRGKGKPAEGDKRTFEGLDPESPKCVPKWEFLLKRGYIDKITFEVTPFGATLQVAMPTWNEQVGTMVPSVLPARLAVENLKSQGVLDKFGRLAKSVTKPTAVGRPTTAPSGAVVVAPRKVDKRPLPKKSLCDRDFMEDGNASIRAEAVANALGVNSIRGRLSTLFGSIPAGVDTIEKRWESLDAPSRLRTLMDESNLNVLKGQSDLWAKALKFGSKVRCPFRGALRLKREIETGPAGGASTRTRPPAEVGDEDTIGEPSELPDDTYDGRD